jgi:hypothetical protein
MEIHEPLNTRNTRCDDTRPLTLSSAGKPIQLISRGKIPAETPIIASDGFLDRLAATHPETYLAELERAYDAMHDKRYASYYDGVVTLVCFALRGSVIELHTFWLVFRDEALSIMAWTVEETKIPEGEWHALKRVARSKKYRYNNDR